MTDSCGKVPEAPVERVLRGLHGIGHGRSSAGTLGRAIRTLAWAGWMIGMLWRHPLTRGRHARVLVTAASWQVWRRTAFGAKGVVVEVSGGPQVRFPPWSKCAMSSVAFGFGDTEQVFLWRYARAGDVLVDVGANIGTYAALALCRGAKVEAFEPDQRTSVVLGSNLKRNGASWRIHAMAAADEDGEARFSIGLDVSNHLLPGHDKDGGVVVPLVRLDTLWRSGAIAGPTILKIDAEGADLAVLRGADAILDAIRPVVIAEIWDGGSGVIDLLEAHGYRLAQSLDGLGNLTGAARADIREGNIIGIPSEEWDETQRRLEEMPRAPATHTVRWIKHDGAPRVET